MFYASHVITNHLLPVATKVKKIQPNLNIRESFKKFLRQWVCSLFFDFWNTSHLVFALTF